MKEVLINKYLRIEPLEHATFMVSEKASFEEIGTVVAKDEAITDIPLGALVYFDSFMAKKYPVHGDETKFQWYIHLDEVVKYEYEEIPK